MRRSLAPLLLTSCFYITEEERHARFDQDGDGVERPFDCDDADPDVSDVVTRFADTDGDGFGDPEAPVASCGVVADTVTDDTDCDDADEASHPGADEICDGEDNDCDRDVDEGLSDIAWYRDLDGDEVGDEEDLVEGCRPPEGYVVNAGDCDDEDPEVHPGVPELCGPVDEDCDGLLDDDPDLVLPTWYLDSDGDGHGAGTGDARCDPPGGWVDVGDDCAPADSDVFPGAREMCNGIDDDCDVDVDEEAFDQLQYYADLDQDGYGDVSQPVDSCPPPGPYLSPNASDCDDTRGDVYPLAPECDDGVDNDCNAGTVGPPC